MIEFFKETISDSGGRSLAEVGAHVELVQFECKRDHRQDADGIQIPPGNVSKSAWDLTT